MAEETRKEIVTSGEPARDRPVVERASGRTLSVLYRVPPSGDLVRGTLVVAAVLALLTIAWSIAEILLLAFAAIIIATGFRALAKLIARWTHLPMGAAVSIAIVVVVLVSVAFFFLLGEQIAVQTESLVDNFPALLNTLGTQFGIQNLADSVIPRVQAWLADPGLLQGVLGLTVGVVGALANFVVALTVGIYLAYRPQAYVDGVLRLVPHGAREHLARAVGKAGEALHGWLKGQLFGMLIVGVLTTIGMMIIGMPSPLTLGLIAGLLEFIPYAGPFLSAAPAVLVAFGEGGHMVLLVIVVFFIVQQFEGNVLTPLIQQQATDLPPVIVILSLAALGVTFGPLGVLLAIPLTVVGMVFVNQLYVRDTLHERVKGDAEVIPPNVD